MDNVNDHYQTNRKEVVGDVGEVAAETRPRWCKSSLEDQTAAGKLRPRRPDQWRRTGKVA